MKIYILEYWNGFTYCDSETYTLGVFSSPEERNYGRERAIALKRYPVIYHDGEFVEWEHEVNKLFYGLEEVSK